MIKAKWSELKSVKPHEYAMRFLVGGVITAIAGLIAKKFGPSFGGLFLAFPAIFPCSVTLIENHEKKKKEQAGLHGTERGRTAASIEAAGTSIGALSLIAFAYIVYRWLPTHNAACILLGATLVWFLLAAVIWRIRIHGHTQH